MRRIAFACSIASIVAFAAASVMSGQGRGNPFHDHSDTGRLVHVLPSPDVIRNPREASDARRGSKLQVFPASFGSGNLIDHGGHEISLAGFFAIYWNGSVANSAGTQGNSTLRSTIQNFVTDFSGAGVPYSQSNPSADYTIIQQYGTRDAISPTLVWAGDFVDSRATQTRISDSGIRSYLAGLFNSGVVHPDTHTIFGVYFPAGMRITLQFYSSCTSFCGYHSNFTYNGQDIKYAVFPFANCSGCSLSGKNVADMLTIVSSHEIRESVSDADGSAWYDAAGDEADDKCAWHNLYQMTKGGFWVQPEYSNGGNTTYPGPGCVVPNK
jgi:hypothetical protein